MSEIKPGNESSEFGYLKLLTVLGLLIAVAGAVGNVPFTPEQLTTWLQKVVAEGAKWTAAISAPLTAAWGWYAALRSSLKKKDLEKNA